VSNTDDDLEDPLAEYSDDDWTASRASLRAIMNDRRSSKRDRTRAAAALASLHLRAASKAELDPNAPTTEQEARRRLASLVEAMGGTVTWPGAPSTTPPDVKTYTPSFPAAESPVPPPVEIQPEPIDQSTSESLPTAGPLVAEPAPVAESQEPATQPEPSPPPRRIGLAHARDDATGNCRRCGQRVGESGAGFCGS